MRSHDSSRLKQLAGWAIGLGFAAAAAAQPNPPTNLTVVPRYEATIRLVLSWSDNSNNEDGFEIERRTVGGAFGALTTVAANATQHIDATATEGDMWEYRVRATSAALGSSAWTPVSTATSPRQVWPINNGDRDVLHAFGSPLNFGGFQYFHDGFDISASGARVDAGRGGPITGINGGVGGTCTVNVDFGTAGIDNDAYLHIVVDAALGAGDMLAPGDRIGTVSTVYFVRDVEANHLHWGNSSTHNLLPFTDPQNRDPNLAPPVVADINNDGQDFIVVDAANNNHLSPRNPAWGDVDFLVDAYDDMSANTGLMASPFNLGYWIQAGVPGGENVRSAAAPYRLIQFDFPLHSAAAAHPIETAVVYYPLSADIQGIDTWQTCFTWRLTNTRGTDGAQGNVDAGQFWRTDARKTTGTQPNGSDAQRARENQEARFPDGTYYVHIPLQDLVSSAEPVRSVLVDNSRPYVRRVTVYSGARIVYQAQWVWDGATAQLALQPATFAAAAPFTALRTQDVTVEVELSEPMATATIASVTPAVGPTPTLASEQPAGARTVWRALISNLDIADDGSEDGDHMLAINGTDLAGNPLLQIASRASLGADHHNRDAAANLRGAAGQDSIHGFRIGPLEGVIPVTALFMKQTAADPATPTVAQKALDLQQALNAYFGEVSYGEISFTVTGHGWYPLALPLNDYYTAPRTPLVDLVQEALGDAQAAGVPLGDYVLVVTDETAARDEWSTSGGWPYLLPGATAPRLVASGVLNLASPPARLTNLAGRMVGLIDLFEYPEVTVARPFVGPWSSMSDRDLQVHVLGWEKWRVGWVDEAGTATGKTLTRVPKPATASPIVDQDHTLLALDSNGNGVKMVAIDVGDRLHYTAEYRREQNLDTGLPGAGVVLVKANDAVNQGEGPAIVQESSATAGDLTDAPFVLAAPRNQFDDAGSGVSIVVTALDAGQAQIRLNYQVPPTQNDVYVALQDDRWVTEDIWIDAPDVNGNFAADPLSVREAGEKPVVGRVNHVIGRVRNLGPADATNFEVELEILEPWGTGGPWRSLKVEIVPLLQGQDTDANDRFLIIADWTPQGDVHSCVKLRARGIANDVNADNNETQENVHEFISSPGSPYSPITTRFQVENPFAEPVPVLYRLDGLPAGWTYLVNPERPVLAGHEVREAQITIQPADGAPLCSREQITLTAYAPRVDTLKRLGAITLQAALKSPASVTAETLVRCDGGQELAVYRKHRQQCSLVTQGCTDPGLPNTQVAVIYTAPDGQSAVRYVTTDANGCFLDVLPAAAAGLWQVEVVLEEQDCRAGDRTPKRPVLMPGGGSASGFGQDRLLYFVHFGPSFPLGELDDRVDPGFTFDFGVERWLTSQFSVGVLLGFHQFYSPVQNERLLQASFSLKQRLFDFGDKFVYAQATAGGYRPQFGSDAFGGSLGAGLTWVLTPKLGLDLGLHGHFVDTSANDRGGARFLTVPFGILWSF